MSRGPNAPQRKPIFAVKSPPTYARHRRSGSADIRACDRMGARYRHATRGHASANARPIPCARAARRIDSPAARENPPAGQSANIPAACAAGCNTCQSARVQHQWSASRGADTQRAARHPDSQSASDKRATSGTRKRCGRQPAADPRNGGSRNPGLRYHSPRNASRHGRPQRHNR